MGFCRRCGDIVVGPRCKCGGTAVAPVVKWPDGSDEPIQDKWSKTYVTKPEPSTARTTDIASPSPSTSGLTSGRRFPRTTVNTSMSNRISTHIASATASRPASPLKQSSTFSQPTVAKAAEGILPSPHGSELAKVYGSVLQPKETLASYACACCSEVFHPDATIYPDPSLSSSTADTTTRFLCRSCFVTNGGSKGECPTCGRPVLVLKSEGGFVESVGRVWHKKCFVCDGCGKNIGDNPMVDLLSRPCCPDCFDSCLKRPIDSPKAPVHRDGKNDRLGGRRGSEPIRESSPTLDELEKRLGVSRTPRSSTTDSHYGSPSMYDAKPRALPGLASTPDRTKSFVSTVSPSTTRYKSPEPDSYDERGSPGLTRYSQTRLKSPELEEDSPSTRRTYRHRSPAHDSLISSPASGSKSSPRTSIQPTEQAIEEMKRRFLTGSPVATPTKASATSSSSTPRRRRSKSRSRSRPRASDTSIVSSSSAEDSAKKHRTLRSTASTSSLRAALRSQRTGDDSSEHDILYPDRTGESTRPLRIARRDRTGDSQTTLQEDVTGGSSYLSGPIRPQRTADIVYGFDAVERQTTGLTVQAQKTGDTDYTTLASQVTGDTTFTRTGPVARQRTGDGIGSQHTGYTMYPPLRPQKTGEKAKSKSSRRQSNEVVDKLGTNRTGDAEVASLLGSFPTDDLIDFSGRTSLSTSSMSKIPVTAGARGLPARGSPASSSTRTSTAASSEGYESSVSSTPDLANDFSDTTSAISSGPSTPPSLSPPPRTSKGDFWTSRSDVHSSSRDNVITPMPKSRTLPSSITIPEHVPNDARCEKCKELLFSIKHGGKFVTVPEEPTSTGVLPKRYHTECFLCKICGDVFEEREGGHAVFVRVEEGACHVRCAPPEKITLRKIPAVVMPKFTGTSVGNTSINASATSTAYYTSSSRYERPLPSAPAQTNTFTSQPRFGGSAVCPGCHKAVSPMERGVVPGPQSTRWHSSCLTCGGERAKGRRKEDGKPGCGKKLDSAAKSDAEGGVWCRECLLLLPAELRQTPTVRSPVESTGTGSRPLSIAPQYTGTTTLARQFTGLGLGTSNEVALPRHSTGGAYSPTKRSTKLYDGPRPHHVYPRPKSVSGTRNTGEGRGMYLVRQLTGGNTSFKDI